MPFEAKIYGFGNGIFHKTSKFVNVKLFEKHFSCYVIEKLSLDIPSVSVPLQELVGYDLELAQSYPHPRLELDIILGLRAIHKFILEKPIKIVLGSIILIPTILGYLTLGPLSDEFCPHFRVESDNCSTNDERALVTNEF